MYNHLQSCLIYQMLYNKSKLVKENCTAALSAIQLKSKPLFLILDLFWREIGFSLQALHKIGQH